MSLTVSALATASSNTSGATLAVTVTAAIGDMLVLAVAADNAGAAGIASLSATVTDSAGNTWVNQGGLINRTPGGVASDGTTLGIWTCLVSATLTAGTITASFSPNTTAKAALSWKAVAPAGQVPTFHSVGAGVTGTGSSATTGAVSVPSGYTFIGFWAAESNNDANPDADTTNGTWSSLQSAIGGTLANVSTAINSQWKTTTAAGNQTFNITSGTRDYALNWLILYAYPDTFGTLAATEAADTAAMSGLFAAFGALAATESPDVAAFAGVTGNLGVLAATEAPDRAAFNVDVRPAECHSLRILLQVDWMTEDPATTRLWDGGGPFVTTDLNVWGGAGAFGDLDEIEQAINGEAATINLTMSGVGAEGSSIAWLDYTNDEIIGSAVTILIQACDADDQPVGLPEIRFSGTIDDISFSDTVADRRTLSTISAAVVNKFTVRRLTSGAVLSDADQKARSAILNPGADPDRFCERVPGLQSKEITWPRWN
jgi:hypothetical protein